MNHKRKFIVDTYNSDPYLFIAGLDAAILGYEENEDRVVYSVKKAVKLLEKQGMSHGDAVDYFYFNYLGSRGGQHPPVWCDDNF